MGTETKSATQAKPAAKAPHALRLTLIFALLLLLLGVAGAEALVLLQHAMRPPSADDTAQLVCTAYTTRNYDALLTRIDPAPLPPDATAPFTSSAQHALRTTLQNLDSGSGDVLSCAYRGLLASDLPQRQYSFVMRRSRVSTPITMLMTLAHQSDGAWLIARSSDFTGIVA